MTIQRYTLEERWVSVVDAATGVALKSPTGKYVLFTDYERQIAKRDKFLMKYRASERDHGWCWIRPGWEGRAAVDMRCNLCKRTDALLEGK